MNFYDDYLLFKYNIKFIYFLVKNILWKKIHMMNLNNVEKLDKDGNLTTMTTFVKKIT